MGQYENLVKALRLCQKDDGCESCAYKKDMLQQFCWLDAMADAAAAIEALQATIELMKPFMPDFFPDANKVTLPKMEVQDA